MRTQVAQTPQGLGDGRKGRETRIETVGGVLKDQLQARPFWRTRKAAGRDGSDVASGKMDGTRRGVEQARDHPYQRGFATAGFTDQANAFARHDGKRDTIDSAQQLGTVLWPRAGAPAAKRPSVPALRAGSVCGVRRLQGGVSQRPPACHQVLGGDFQMRQGCRITQRAVALASGTVAAGVQGPASLASCQEWPLTQSDAS